MGLRDYLASLQAGAEGAQQFADSAQKLRTQAELRQLGADIPGLLDAGNVNQIAGQSAAAGNFGPLNELLQSQMKTSTAGTPLTEQQLIANGVSPSKAPILASMNYLQQRTIYQRY